MFGTSISGWLHHCGFGFLADISVEVLVQACFFCSIQYCVPLCLSEYHIPEAVKHLGQWIIYEVLHSQCAVPNKHAGSGSVIHLLSFVLRNVHESQASEHMEMLQIWLLAGPMPGLVLSLTNC